MKVKIPEPVGNPLIHYVREIKNQRFDDSELIKLIKKFEDDFDEVSTQLDDRIRFFGYYLVFQRADNLKYLEIMDGGYFFEGEVKKRSSESPFKKQYQNLFNSILNKRIDFPLNIEIELIGFRDTISKEVEVRNPK